MPNYKESGLLISLPDGNSFRFAEMGAYQKLSGLRLKEMDFGWWEQEKQTLWLLEVKGEEVWETASDENYFSLVNTLVQKAQDSLMILASVWSGSETGKEFSHFLPELTKTFPEKGRIAIVFVLHTPSFRRALLPAIRDKVNHFLAGKLRLFDIKRVMVIDQQTATAKGLPVRTDSAD